MDSNEIDIAIHPLARECRDAFNDCVADPVLGGEAWCRSAQGVFNLWCNTLKATRTDKSSLDSRLRRNPGVRQAIRNLLMGLSEVLQTCRQLAAGALVHMGPISTSVYALPFAPPMGSVHGEINHEPDMDGVAGFSDASPPPELSVLELYPETTVAWDVISNESGYRASLSSDEASDPLLSEQISYAKKILDKLLRILLAIRKSGTKPRFDHIDKTVGDHDFLDFRRHLTTIISRGFPSLTEEARNLDTAARMEMAAAYKLNLVQKHLIKANVLRRNRIKSLTSSRSAQNHTVRPVQSSAPATASMPTPEDGVPTAPVNQPTPLSPRPTPGIAVTPSPLRAPGKSTMSEIFSVARTATAVAPSLDVNGIVDGDSTSRSTGVTRIGASQTYPRCPKPGLGGLLICPYCNDPLPPEFAKPKNKNRWQYVSHSSPSFFLEYGLVADHNM